MLADPEMIWEDDDFPYDALRAAAITPDSTQGEIRDASFVLIEQGTWTGETRRAWDRLRMIENRLWVDFLLYEGSSSEIAARLCDLLDPGGNAPPIAVLSPPLAELDRLDRDFQPFQSREEPVRALPRHWLPGLAMQIEFDA